MEKPGALYLTQSDGVLVNPRAALFSLNRPGSQNFPQSPSIVLWSVYNIEFPTSSRCTKSVPIGLCLFLWDKWFCLPKDCPTSCFLSLVEHIWTHYANGFHLVLILLRVPDSLAHLEKVMRTVMGRSFCTLQIRVSLGGWWIQLFCVFITVFLTLLYRIWKLWEKGII